MLKDLVELLAKSLVDDPDVVEVKEIESEKLLVYEIRVPSQYIGRVIGKQGRIIKALRTVVKAAAARDGKRVAVEVLE